MNRSAMKDLVSWKDSLSRKPLLFQGARQVGKTWLLKEFGRQNFENTAYVNFDRNEMLRHIFDGDYSVKRILTALQLACGKPIVPGKTLLIFDEIQEAPRAVGCLKYFCEEAPQYHIAAAGSYLGVASLEKTSFPVGKVNTLVLHPLSYLEFLEAMGQERFAQLLRSHDWQTIALFKDTLIEYLRYYYVVGGMPEAVEAFSQRRDFGQVRALQRELLRNYENDFGKHTPGEIIPNIRMIWDSVPVQLAKENKKFFLSQVQKKARKTDFSEAIEWLCNAGFLYRVRRISKPSLPLSAYVEEDIFKLFFLDVGLLGAQANLDPRVLLEGNRIFTEFKGALTEQYVQQQLLAETDFLPFYWAGPSNEVDFVFQYGTGVMPLEVKAETNLRARSLMYFCRKNRIPMAVRSSMIDYRVDWTDTIPSVPMDGEEFKFLLANLPLYALASLPAVCEELARRADKGQGG